jgi:hypothetical protein
MSPSQGYRLKDKMASKILQRHFNEREYKIIKIVASAIRLAD